MAHLVLFYGLNHKLLGWFNVARLLLLHRGHFFGGMNMIKRYKSSFSNDHFTLVCCS